MTERIALVTGANRGIGFAVARRLAEAGLVVVAGARGPEAGREAAESLRSDGLDVHWVAIDVTRPSSIQAAVGKTVDRFGRIDVLVNNAGVMLDASTPLLALNLTILQNTLEANAFGPLLLCQACIPHMKAGGYGRIVNIASTLGSLHEIASPDSPYAGLLSPAYRLSKTFLNGLTVLLAREVRGTNVLVNSACPGWVRTRMGGEEAPRSAEEAADTPVWLATLPDDGPTGGFFRDRQPIPW
jgi:NAD(P)-dependent dehydrogenase (short-subunit alcohol dehydrogenase family)